MNQPAGIRVDSLTKTYRKGNVRALDGVSLAIEPGEVFGVIGPNGAGKTTLLGCLLGLLRPDSGHISIDGRPPDDLAIRSITGYLPERLTFDRWMTGAAFLSYHHRLARLPAASEKDEVQQALRKVGLEDAATRPIKKYSRGMLQRIGFAQALLGNPRYLFLDEPASGVDPLGVMTFRSILSDVKAKGVTVILNSHQLEQVERLCNRVAFVSHGKVTAVETLEAGAQVSRVLRVRWAFQINGEPVVIDPAQLQAIAQQAGAAVIEIRNLEAFFQVDGDASAAGLLKLLTRSDVPVIEATPEQGRLERLFLEPSHNK